MDIAEDDLREVFERDQDAGSKMIDRFLEAIGQSREHDPMRDIARIIEMGVVNEPFPACRRTGLFKIHPHHDEVAIGNFALHLGQPSRIVQSGLWIVNRTGTDNDQQAVIISAQDRPGCLTRPCNQAENTSGCGKLFFDASRRHQPRHSRNADILNRKAGYIRLRFISHKESP